MLSKNADTSLSNVPLFSGWISCLFPFKYEHGEIKMGYYYAPGDPGHRSRLISICIRSNKVMVGECLELEEICTEGQEPMVPFFHLHGVSIGVLYANREVLVVSLSNGKVYSISMKADHGYGISDKITPVMIGAPIEDQVEEGAEALVA